MEKSNKNINKVDDNKNTIQSLYNYFNNNKDKFIKCIDKDMLNNDLDKLIKQNKIQGDKLIEEKKNNPFICHIESYEISHVITQYTECIDKCKSCCKKLDFNDNDIKEIINIKKNETLCCKIYQEIDLLHQKAKKYISFIKINLNIKEMINVKNEKQKYQIGNIKNITKFKAKEIQKTIKEQLMEAEKCFEIAQNEYKIYQNKRKDEYKIQYDDKINKYNDIIYDLTNLKDKNSKYKNLINDIYILKKYLNNLFYDSQKTSWTDFIMKGIKIVSKIYSCLFTNIIGGVIGGIFGGITYHKNDQIKKKHSESITIIDNSKSELLKESNINISYNKILKELDDCIKLQDNLQKDIINHEIVNKVIDDITKLFNELIK